MLGVELVYQGCVHWASVVSLCCPPQRSQASTLMVSGELHGLQEQVRCSSFSTLRVETARWRLLASVTWWFCGYWSLSTDWSVIVRLPYIFCLISVVDWADCLPVFGCMLHDLVISRLSLADLFLFFLFLSVMFLLLAGLVDSSVCIWVHFGSVQFSVARHLLSCHQKRC